MSRVRAISTVLALVMATLVIAPSQPAGAAIAIDSAGSIQCDLGGSVNYAPVVRSSGAVAVLPQYFYWDGTQAVPNGYGIWWVSWQVNLSSGGNQQGSLSQFGQWVTVVDWIWDYDARQWTSSWVGSWCQT